MARQRNYSIVKYRNERTDSEMEGCEFVIGRKLYYLSINLGNDEKLQMRQKRRIIYREESVL